LAAGSAACGSLDGHTGSPEPLATIQGALTNTSNVPVGNDVRVAVVWVAVDGQHLSVSEDLPVQPVFPSSFVIQLTAPPPASAIQPLPGSDSTSIALGAVVAYEDLNGNGQLDLVPDDAGAFIDKIVGANESMYLVYIAGALSPALNAKQTGTPTLGYNLGRASSCQVMPPGPGATADGGQTCSQDKDEWLPITTPYDLPLSSDPQVNQIMCANGTSASGGGSFPSVWDVGRQGTPPGGYPAPGSPGLTCNGSTSYEFQVCQTKQLLCSTETDCFGSSVMLGAASPPPGWPCP
jgi:hypothetical protein